jgi:tRNA G18 (ribose-2'-O)-methylase SpoU
MSEDNFSSILDSILDGILDLGDAEIRADEMDSTPFERHNVLDIFQGVPPDTVRAEYIQNALPEKIGCLNLTGDQNVAMIVRTASSFGLSEVAIIGRRPYHRRATVGMHRYIPTNFYRAAQGHHSEEYDIPAILQLLQQFSETHTIVFVEQGGQDIREAFRKPLARPAFFVMGNENQGIPEEILAYQPRRGSAPDDGRGPQDHGVVRVSIPQCGVGRSFNVAIAASIVLWEYFR